MKNIKIIFFDIDGTLIDVDTKKVTPKMLETLRRLKEKGIIICIATGRAPMAVPTFEGVEFDAILTYNGSYCFNQKEIIYSNPLEQDDVQKMIQNAEVLGRPVSVATKDQLISNGTDEDLDQYYAFGKQTVIISDDFDRVSQGTVYQLLMSCRESDFSTILDGVHGAKITSWWDRAVDIIPATGGKGTGIAKVLKYYGFDRSEALAFGDGNNDVEMFQAVGTGVAMENASERLKAVATDHCGHVAEDGIYYYCVEHGLI